MNEDLPQADALEFGDTHDSPSHEEPRHRSQSVKKKPNKLGFFLIMGLFVAIPVGLVLAKKMTRSEADPRTARSQRPAISETPAPANRPSLVETARAQARPGSPLTYDDLLSAADRERVRAYPKTSSQLAQEQQIVDATQAEREKLARSQEKVERLITRLEALAARLEATSGGTVQANSRLNQTADRLQSVGSNLEASMTELSEGRSPFVSGQIYRSPRQVIPLSDYKIRSLMGGIVVVSVSNLPGQYLQLEVGSEVPGHGRVSRIEAAGKATKIYVENAGEEVGYIGGGR